MSSRDELDQRGRKLPDASPLIPEWHGIKQKAFVAINILNKSKLGYTLTIKDDGGALFMGHSWANRKRGPLAVNLQDKLIGSGHLAMISDWLDGEPDDSQDFTKRRLVLRESDTTQQAIFKLGVAVASWNAYLMGSRYNNLDILCEYNILANQVLKTQRSLKLPLAEFSFSFVDSALLK